MRAVREASHHWPSETVHWEYFTNAGLANATDDEQYNGYLPARKKKKPDRLRIAKPEQRTGRPRLALADIIFSSTYKVYSTVSGRALLNGLERSKSAGLSFETAALQFSLSLSRIGSIDTVSLRVDHTERTAAHSSRVRVCCRQ